MPEQRDGVGIRAARHEDAADIARLLREVGWFDALQQESPSVTTARIEKHLADCLADRSHSVLVASDPQLGVLGYISVHWLPYLFLSGPEGYVSELFVLAEQRGKGIGRSLLQSVQQEAQQRGCARLMLITGRGRESYQRAFYNGLGWRLAGAPRDGQFRLFLIFHTSLTAVGCQSFAAIQSLL